MDEGSRARWLFPVLAGGVVIALVVVALVREPVQLDPDTPQGTVQEYLQAIADKDWEGAFEVLDPDAVSGCQPADLARHGPTEPFTATLSGEGADRPVFGEPETTVPANAVWVEVTLRFGTTGPFGTSWETWEWFSLIERDGSWWIVGDPWPYFIWECRKSDL